MAHAAKHFLCDPFRDTAAALTLPRMSDWIDPPAHFLTWRTYGTWLPGDERGWTDARRNGFAEPTNFPDPHRENIARARMGHSVFVMTPAVREAVDRAIRDACGWRGWEVLALNVRTNHVHLVLAGDPVGGTPVVTLKARVSRALWEAGKVSKDQPIWSRGGSHRILRRTAELEAAMDYVINRQ